jgi:hypothetical protein
MFVCKISKCIISHQDLRICSSSATYQFPFSFYSISWPCVHICTIHYLGRFALCNNLASSTIENSTCTDLEWIHFVGLFMLLQEFLRRVRSCGYFEKQNTRTSQHFIFQNVSCCFLFFLMLPNGYLHTNWIPCRYSLGDIAGKN